MRIMFLVNRKRHFPAVPITVNANTGTNRQTEHSLLLSTSPPEVPKVEALGSGGTVSSVERLPSTRLSLRSEQVTKAKKDQQSSAIGSVSYTHLTLPTILLV